MTLFLIGASLAFAAMVTSERLRDNAPTAVPAMGQPVAEPDEDRTPGREDRRTQLVAGAPAGGLGALTGSLQPDQPLTPWLPVERLTVEDPRQVTPNVIVLLSEAFWDPTQISSVRFSRDPIPNFHRLAAEYPSGILLSPQYGGLTANVELEVLTGLSMRFLNTEVLEYENSISRPVDSLASIFTRQGYVATAISPFHSWFANSREVYRRLGFSRFIPLEYFPPDYAGPYIADRAVARKIVEESERSAGPDFIFANTMENHYHYWPGKFEKNTIEAMPVDAPILGGALGLLETLAQGLQGADRMLKSLVDHYSRSSEPTIIVFFGDHLPALEKDYMGYRATGYLKDNDPDELFKLHSVPVLVWDNFLPAKHEPLRLSPSFLGPYVLNRYQREGTPFMNFLYSLSQRMPILPPQEQYAEFRVRKEDAREYAAIQKDILEGGQAIYGDAKSRIAPADFILGYGPPRIDSLLPASLPAADGPLAVTVRGGRYGLGCTVFANGQPLKT